MLEEFFAPALADWIDNKISERAYRRLFARIDALRESLADKTVERDPDDPLRRDLGDGLFGLVMDDGKAVRVLTYYTSRDGRRLNFLTEFSVDLAKNLAIRASDPAVKRARALMEKAIKAGDVLDDI